MTPPVPKELEALLAHAGWIRSLARTLVSDPNRADDLVQQTWVAALEHPPGPSVSPRRWLAAVMRNFSRQVRRGDLRRLDRESQAARPEARPSAHETIEAIAVQRELFEAVIGLDEPYRTTIFERFYEDLAPREIARRHGIPVKTVKTRLSRGLERLRADLDRRHEGRREAWLPALLPLAGWPGLPAPTVGMLVMNTKVKIAACALLLVGTLAVVWIANSKDQQGATAHAGSRPQALEPDTKPESSTLAQSSEPGHRAAAAEAASPDIASAPGPTAVVLVHGRVVDMRGLPMPGVPVCSCARVFRTGLEMLRAAQHATSESVATTTADGSFSAPLPEDGATFVACGSDLTTVFAADVWSSRAPQEVLVVVAPRGGVAGIVVDSEGRPIPEATIEIRPRPVVLRGLGAITDQSFEVPWRAKSDDGGRFEIPDAPAMADADLVTTAVGWSETRIALPERPTFDLRIVLQGDEEEILRGEVVDPEGRPVSGARVACSTEATRTDEEGRFVLRSGSTITTVGKGAQMNPYVVQALKEGWLPARLVRRPENRWPDPIVLRLQGEPLVIQGRVLDEDGEAMVDVEVGSVDEHPFGIERNELGGGSWKSTEQLLRGGAESVRTAGDGSFVLGGLLPGRYRISCLEKKTMRSATTEPTEAGTKGLVLRLASDARCVRVAGRVLTRAGAPLAGILVFPSHGGERWPFGDSLPVHGDGTVTDAEGRFEFERISPEGMALHLSSQDTIIVDWRPAADAKLDDLHVTVSRRCHLQIDLGDRKDMANYFSVLDEKGEKLTLWEHKGPMATPRSMSPINDGRSSVIAVPEEGRTVVLQRGNEEVARLPIELVPGELKILRP